jgi:putative CocE/NonD family hydrolase
MAPRVRDDLPHAVRTVETEWITVSDGIRLAARLWLPEDSGPVPAILEYLPYRLSDGTQAGDAQQMGWFAGHGYACARVDIRGTGNSGGIIEDEYSEQELLDGLEVIAWLAAQPWCDGKVGMVGTSWSGFNGLQLAARTPSALRAVVSYYASDDRYADDVHYRGGLVIPMDMAQWANCMLSWNALPPDPAIACDDWRAQWSERLERTPHFVEQWLTHQRRDAYWRHGSACEHYEAIRCPVMAIGGWTDGYTDAVLRLLEHLDVPRRGLIGPWGHNDPVHGVPAPAVGSLGECVRFFDRWLKGLPNGVDEEPMLTAWQQDSVPPRARYDERPGRWVSLASWPPATGSEFVLQLGAGGVLATEPGARAVLELRGAQTTGLDGGAWCADGHSDDLPFDQRADDGRSLCFDSEPLEQPLEMLGHAQAALTLVSDRPLGLVSVRLCELLPGGASLLVTRGQLNLTHRDGHDRVVPLIPGEPVSVRVPLDAIGHRFSPGSRLRVALSPTYWPLAWPSPEVVTLGVVAGESSIALPLYDAATAPPPPALCPPEEPPPYPMTELVPGHGARTITRELGSGRTTLRFDWDLGGTSRDELTGTEITFEADALFEIVEDDPLSARVACTNVTALRREADGWDGRSEARTEMTCDAGSFRIESQLRVLDGGVESFVRTWSFSVPRDGG